MKRIHRVAALALLAALSACDNVPSPTAPLRPKDLAPAFGIFDGAHGGGNTRFFFLPPMVSKPAINAEFHPGLRPRIDICEIENGACKAGPTFKSFSAADVKVSTTEKHYHVNWDTKSPDVDTAKTYRIQVLLGDTPIGFADVDAVANGSLMKQVNANEYIPLVDGRTLPIKFFLGKGVTCEVNQSNCAEHTVTSAVGGDFAAADERFWLKFPTNVFPAGFEEVTITIERKPVPRGKACHTLHLQGADSDEDTEPALAAEYEGCYRVTMDRNSDDFVEAGGFQQPVTVAMCLTGIERTNRLLRIYKSDPQPRGLVALEDADPAVIAGFSQACEGFEPTPLPNPDGPIGALQSGLRNLASAVGRLLTPKSLYAIDLGLGGEIGIGGGFSDFGWGIEGSLEAREPLTRTTTPGSSQAFSVSVHGFLHHHDEPDLDDVSSGEHGSEQSLAGVDVRFELLLDGTVVGSKVVTSALEEGDSDENGHIDAVAIASFDFATVGTYSVRATLAHSGGSPVSFVVTVAATGSIVGTVVDFHTGAPIAGATVKLFSPAPETALIGTVVTGSDGVFEFGNLAPGEYFDEITGPAGYTNGEGRINVFAGQVTRPALPLLPSGGIAGIVTNAVTGAAIAGANVLILDTETRAVTNTEGRFSFPNLRAGSYRLRTTFEGFAPKTTEVTVGADQAHVTIALATPADLAVTSFTFSPAEPTIADRVTYNITVTNIGGTTSEAGLATLTEFRDGAVGQINPNLALPPIGPGLTASYTLLSADFGASSRSTTFTVNTGTPPVPDANAANNAGTVTFTVTGALTGTVLGKVTDAATGLPLNSAAITVDGVTGQWFTNSVGNYSLQAPQGLRTLRASRLGYATAQATIRIIDGEVTLNFALQPAPDLPGGGGTCTVNCTTTPP